MLDNAPLRALLERELDLDRVARAHRGRHTARAGDQRHQLHDRARRDLLSRRAVDRAVATDPASRRTRDHRRRSPARVDRDTVHLSGGARRRRLLRRRLDAADRAAVAGAAPGRAQHPGHRGRASSSASSRPPGQRAEPPRYPSFAQVAGHALSSIFLDNLGADLERMQRLNRVLDLVPREIQRAHPEIAHVDALVLGAEPRSGSTGDSLRRSPADRRALSACAVSAATEGTGANLLSYLLFDRDYCRELLALGYADAMARRDEIEAFLGGETAGYLPFFPAELLR